MNKNKPEEKKQIESVIIESELKEWEDWGNKWFGTEPNRDDVWSPEDNKKDKNTKRQ